MTNNIDEIRKIIKQKRLERGLTMKDIANKVGVSEATVSRWESGDIENMKRDKIVKLAEALGISPAVIMGWEMNTRSLEPVDVPEMVPIPILGCIHAGEPATAAECIEDEPAYIPSDWINKGEIYRGLRVKGDSMTPKIQPGDVVIFRVSNSAETGDIVVARVNGDDATLKKLIKSDTAITLQPLNTAYDPIVFTGDDSEPTLEIIGVVVRLIREL